MIGAQYILPLARELVVDLFAGGGGASTGIEQARDSGLPDDQLDDLCALYRLTWAAD